MTYLQTIAEYPFLFFFLIILFGLLIGSFLNVVIYRLPIMMIREWRTQCEEFLLQHPSADSSEGTLNLFIPRSHCPSCHHMISAWYNIPILSFLLLRGKCAYCHHKIPYRYPLVELLTAALMTLLIWQYGFTLTGLATIIFTLILLVLTFIDLDQQLLPDQLTLSLLWLGLFFNLFTLFTPLESAVIGALVGYLSLWLVANLFKYITKKEGMGYGDFKLFAAIGAWLGWQSLLSVILMASFIGAIVGISAILIKKHDHKVPIPFGPFLALAGWIGLIWGQTITNYYFQFLQ